MQRVSLCNAEVTFDAGCVVPGPRDRCWVTSLVTLLGPMARQEIRRELTGITALSAIGLSHLVETGLRLTQADKVVFPAHQLLTTSLYDDGEAERLHAITWPDRAVVLRSLNPHHHADVLAQGRNALKRKRNSDLVFCLVVQFNRKVVPTLSDGASGGTLWPVRVVWIIDDVARDWRPRRDARRDLQWLDSSGLERRRYAGPMPAAALDRVLALYRRLYIERYSRHNPDYTADYLQDLLDKGTLGIMTLERDGEIMAFCALHRRGQVLSVPMVGYDPSIDGLYRAVMALPALEAEAQGLALNLSAGAARFKRHRGAEPHVEYLLILDDHLPVWRRLAYRGTAALLQALEPRLIKAATR